MTNKKSKKKRTKLKKTGAKKAKPVKKTVRKKLARTKAVSKSKPPLKKATVKTKAAPGKKTAGAKAAGAQKKRVRVGSQIPDMEAFPPQGLRLRSAGQSGDLQGLSNVEAADSESVEELIEEGNAFEANVVTGVERAEDADEKEVITHEVPEDDVPGEYLDKD
jgi:hypothetical protein